MEKPYKTNGKLHFSTTSVRPESQTAEPNKTIILKERDVNESQLDFYFLTSPAEIEKKIIMLGQINYSPIKNSKIFISFSSFNSMENKISTINNLNEKKN